MLYSSFQGLKLSQLGFGTMRLPTDANGTIDQAQVQAMVDHAMAHGVNYFDTAYPYHNSLSEGSIGKALAKYPRESWYLANKYPGHQIASTYDPEAIFEEQLKKCGVEYFDFYLLHNVYENSMPVYLDPQWGILDYFRKQKQLGRIKHLGFSTHAQLDNMREFLDIAGDDMEFCQIQLNWLDWDLQDAKAKVELLRQRNIPIIVMEPLRGGRLCELDDAAVATLQALRPQETIPAWSFRFLQSIPEVMVTLSGMSSLQQMQENVATYETAAPLKEEELQALLHIAGGMTGALPCTACRYCTDHCPMQLDIPMMLRAYNDLQFSASVNTSMRFEGIPAEQLPAACIGCGQCAAMCPQRIDIPTVLKDLSARLEKMPKWVDISRQREEAARLARG